MRSVTPVAADKVNRWWNRAAVFLMAAGFGYLLTLILVRYL